MIEGFSACVLALSEVRLEPVEDGWEEQATLTVDAEGACPWIDIPLPPGVHLDRWKARVSRQTGRSGRLKSDREERRVRDLTGRGAVRIHTPEIANGDRVVLEITRSWPATTYPWAPGGQEFAEIVVDTDVPPPSWGRAEDGGVWTDSAEPGAVWQLPHPTPAVPPAAAAAPEATLDLELTYDLIVPGNPQLSLYPGGGSRYIATWSVEGPAEPSRRGFVVPTGPGPKVQVEGPHEVRDDSILLVAESGDPFEHQVEIEARDAPTYGLKVEVPGAEVTQVVKGERVRVEWEQGKAWYVSAVDLRPLLPERPRLLIALDRRFRRASSPEPAVPTYLKGRPTDLELVAELRPALQERTGIGWPTEQPLFPRKLVKSRNQHAMSTVEASLALWTQLSQLQIPSAWGVVLPAPEGQGFYAAPAGYTVGVVGVKTPDGSVWIDPGCKLCAPFELRPHLEGASMLSPAGRFTPDPTPGAVEVVDAPAEEGGFTRTVTLTGPPALLERQRLARLRKSARTQALASWWCGSCKITAADGLGVTGQPITLAFTSQTAPTVDPLDAEHLASPFERWHDWVGARSWTRPTASSARTWAEDPVQWSREPGEDATTETLTFEERRLTEGVLDRWRDARDRADEEQALEEREVEDESEPEGDEVEDQSKPEGDEVEDDGVEDESSEPEQEPAEAEATEP